MTPERPAGAQDRLQHGSRAERISRYREDGYQVKSASPDWDSLLATLAAEIKVRHYSRRTLKTYANWSRQFQRFLKDKTPRELTTADFKEYLTYLAVECQVAASTQDQAFNSLLFLYRHALKRGDGGQSWTWTKLGRRRGQAFCSSLSQGCWILDFIAFVHVKL